jgi:hypothetical protein
MTIQTAATRLLALDWAQRSALLRAWAMGVVCVVWLRFGSFESARRTMLRLAGVGHFSAADAAWIASAGSGRAPGAKCLVRALVGEALLRASGHDPRLCIGVALDGGFRAHAWVEVDGRAVVGSAQDGEYSRLAPVKVVTA